VTGPLDPVTPSEVDSYQQNGYIQYPSFFTASEIAPLRAAIDDAVATGRDRILGAEGGGRRGEAYERVFNQTMEMEAGGVTSHHSCTFHRAGPNRSDRPRRAFSIIYVPEWVRFTGEWNAGSTPPKNWKSVANGTTPTTRSCHKPENSVSALRAARGVCRV